MCERKKYHRVKITTCYYQLYDQRQPYREYKTSANRSTFGPVAQAGHSRANRGQRKRVVKSGGTDEEHDAAGPAVMWLMRYKRMPFAMVLINPGSKGDTGSRNPAYLAKNPGGTIPTIEERDTGFVLGEAHAIMCYLSNKHGWDDVYPADSRRRAKVAG